MRPVPRWPAVSGAHGKITNPNATPRQGQELEPTGNITLDQNYCGKLPFNPENAQHDQKPVQIDPYWFFNQSESLRQNQ